MARGKEISQTPATRLVTGGRSNDPHVVNVPVYRASTHLYPDCAALRSGADAAVASGKAGASGLMGPNVRMA